MAQVGELLALAILEKSARKLRSAMGDETAKRLNLTGHLEGMIAALEAIRPMLEDAERRSVSEDPARDWLRRVRANAHAVEDMVDELQDTRPHRAAGTVSRMRHCLGKKKSMAKKMDEIKEKLKMIQGESCGFGFIILSDASVEQVTDVVPETTTIDDQVEEAMSTDDEGVSAAVDSDISDAVHTDQDKNQQFSDVLPSFIRSFQNMPLDLRLCVAYVAVIPKGQEVYRDDLINQWIALHLIEPAQRFSAWQLAEEYIGRLLGMSFLETTNSSLTSLKGNITLTVNDLFHDFTVSVMGDELISLDGMGTSYVTKYCRYATAINHDFAPLKLLSSSIRALYCVDCSKMELRDDSFSFARWLRVLYLCDSPMKNLPDSICQLRYLEYLNLGNCHALATLPESFGDLLNLCHVSLSGCYGLAKLPESFAKLENLVYLDLSLCSCFDGIAGVLSCLTNLQRLILGLPFCYLAEHRFQLEGLKNVWNKLTKLCYLNLSKFLDPIIYYHQSEKETSEYIGCLSGLSSLEYLNLSNNIFLPDIPLSFSNLTKLRTLDLSGCARLKRLDKRIVGMTSLENIYLGNCQSLESHQFVVRTQNDSSSNIVELEGVSCEELEISNLEEVKPGDQLERIRLAEKQKLQKLKLCWTVGLQASSDENILLGSLVPPLNLKCLELHGFSGMTCFPSWWTSMRRSELPDLVDVTMEDIPMIRRLPPLGALPNLRRLVLRKIANITRIDAKDLSGGNATAFRQLSEFTIDEMQRLAEFSGGNGEFMFHAIDELLIQKCPELSFGPLPPRARRLVISGCDNVMSSWRTNAGGQGRHGVKDPSCSSPAVTELVVESCKVPYLGDWSLLLHLPGLETLRVSQCDSLRSMPQHLADLTSLRELKIESCKQFNYLPQSMQNLSSLQSMLFSDCRSITSIPEWFRYLTSLEKLSIDRCPAIQSLPQSIDKLPNLKDLHVSYCRDLTRWCQFEKNKKRLGRIQIKHEEYGQFTCNEEEERAPWSSP